eukprot:12918259-Alexandrium_andersonii.AAC.1
MVGQRTSYTPRNGRHAPPHSSSALTSNPSPPIPRNSAPVRETAGREVRGIDEGKGGQLNANGRRGAMWTACGG